MNKSRADIKLEPYIGLIPGIAVFLAFVIVPIIFSFYYSFTDYNGFPGSKVDFVGLRNFKDAILTNRIETLYSIKNSFLYAVIITILQNLIAVFIAILLAARVRLSDFYRAVFFFPNVLGAFTIAQIWSLLMNPNYGPLTKILESIGFSPNFLGDPKTAIYSVIFVQIWTSVGYAMIIYYTNIMSISTDVFEAADIDGTNFGQKVKHIIVPLIIPSFTINILLSLIGALKLFDIIFIMTAGGPAGSTQNLPVYIFLSAFQFSKHGYGAALNVIQFFIIFGVTVLVMRILKGKGVEY